jgi:hypothetical protein
MSDIRWHSKDDDVTRGLRALYAAPDGDAYWNELEARIMARVSEVEFGWWAELDRWAKPALAAAAVLIFAAGVAMFRAREVQATNAYGNLLAPPQIPVDNAVRPMMQDDRDGTLRFVLTRE